MQQPLSTRPSRRAILAIALALLLPVLLAAIMRIPTAFAADGDLDSTFGTGGLVTTDAGSNGAAHGVAMQADGKIVIAGTNGATFLVARYNVNGSLDTSFGGAGVVSTNFGNTDKAYGVALQGDGKIVAAGVSGNDFALARYETSGTLDTTFGNNGLVTTDFNSITGYTGAGGYGVAIDSNGRIVVVGYVQHGSEYEDFAIVRYTPTGALDTTFNPGGALEPGVPGIVTTEVQSQEPDRAYAVAVQPDNKIIAVGETKGSPGQFAMTRYTESGALDTTLGGDGIVSAGSNKVGPGYGVALQPDGKIVVTGSIYVRDLTTQNCIDSAGRYCEYKDFWVARFATNGAPDNNFGTAGEVITPINPRGNDDDGRDVVIQPDGKIVVAGYTDSSLHTFSGEDENFTRRPDFALARYTPNGALDTSFGTGGKVVTDFTPADDEGHEAYALTLQTDGKIVAVGASRRDFALARYTAGPIPTTTTVVDQMPNPSEVGEEVSFFLEVMAPSAIAPTGLITITNGITLCDGLVEPDMQTMGLSTFNCALIFDLSGTFSITATYSGDATFSGSTAIFTQTVTANQDTSTVTTLTTAPNPSSQGQPVALEATVVSGAGTPTGTVAFGTVANGTFVPFGVAQLDGSGKATYNWTPPAAASYLVRADYTGDGTYQPSSSTTVTQIVLSGVSVTPRGYFPVILK